MSSIENDDEAFTVGGDVGEAGVDDATGDVHLVTGVLQSIGQTPTAKAHDGFDGAKGLHSMDGMPPMCKCPPYRLEEIRQNFPRGAFALRTYQ